jgi:polyphosphate kinase
MIDYDSNVSRDMRNMIGDKPKNILKQIQKTVIELQAQFQQIYQGIISELEGEHIFIINEKQLNKQQAALLRNISRRKSGPSCPSSCCTMSTGFPI